MRQRACSYAWWRSVMASLTPCSHSLRTCCVHAQLLVRKSAAAVVIQKLVRGRRGRKRSEAQVSHSLLLVKSMCFTRCTAVVDCTYCHCYRYEVNTSASYYCTAVSALLLRPGCCSACRHCLALTLVAHCTCAQYHCTLNCNTFHTPNRLAQYI
jgi:hypothetical protein